MVVIVALVCLVVGGVLGYAFRGKEHAALAQAGQAVAGAANSVAGAATGVAKKV